MRIVRNKFGADGIFGALFTPANEQLCFTLEHAYRVVGQGFKPKIPTGTYTCVRGVHQLRKGIPFESFEVTGIDGHSGIIFHPGNTNKDSDGCILVGEVVEGAQILRSRLAFITLMQRLRNVESFVLTIEGTANADK